MKLNKVDLRYQFTQEEIDSLAIANVAIYTKIHEMRRDLITLVLSQYLGRNPTAEEYNSIKTRRVPYSDNVSILIYDDKNLGYLTLDCDSNDIKISFNPQEIKPEIQN